MGVADVHMPVDEARRKRHPRAVNNLAGGNIGQRGGLAHLGDAPAPYDYGTVGDDAPFRVHSDDVAGAGYLEGVVRHFPCSSPMVAPPAGISAGCPADYRLPHLLKEVTSAAGRRLVGPKLPLG